MLHTHFPKLRQTGINYSIAKFGFNEVDGGKDDAMNRIIWFYAKGEAKYPETK